MGWKRCFVSKCFMQTSNFLHYIRSLMTICSVSSSHLKGMWRVVYTVHSQAVVHRGSLHTAKHSNPQSLYGGIGDWLPHQSITARPIQQQVTVMRVHQAIAGGWFIIYWHYFLRTKERDRNETCSQIRHSCFFDEYLIVYILHMPKVISSLWKLKIFTLMLCWCWLSKSISGAWRK